jgi:hypothetical protein
MEDSLKGTILVLALIALFSTSIISYISLFPVEQGVSYSDATSNSAFLSMQNNTDIGSQATLTSLQNNTSSSFDQWDITVGYMGSNAIKQTTKTGISGYVTNVFSQMQIMARLIFGSGSPIVYALTILSVIAAGWIIYIIIAFIRSGK